MLHVLPSSSCTVLLSCARADRLPKLSSVDFIIEGPPLPDMLPMAMLLLSLRTQLTGLQSLSLELSQSWGKAGLAWMELASMTQLTMLSITSTYKVWTVLGCLHLLMKQAAMFWAARHLEAVSTTCLLMFA